jgi:hypothetical protein
MGLGYAQHRRAPSATAQRSSERSQAFGVEFADYLLNERPGHVEREGNIGTTALSVMPVLQGKPCALEHGPHSEELETLAGDLRL